MAAAWARSEADDVGVPHSHLSPMVVEGVLQ